MRRYMHLPHTASPSSPVLWECKRRPQPGMVWGWGRPLLFASSSGPGWKAMSVVLPASPRCPSLPACPSQSACDRGCLEKYRCSFKYKSLPLCSGHFQMQREAGRTASCTHCPVRRRPVLSRPTSVCGTAVSTTPAALAEAHTRAGV